MEKKIGKLYICGTPIGNLEDITLRCLETLKKVDLIAAEDTRHTKILLNHYQIKKPITSYHEFSSQKKIEYIFQLLKTGRDIALVSDAGMPGICDPGFEIINKAIEDNIAIIPIPGVSASTTALVVSGFAMERFVFEGFIPRKKKEKEKFFTELQDEERTMIFYETPHRIKDTLLILKKIIGDRRIVIARELTKLFEEIIRGDISNVIERLSSKDIKGEITIVLEGNRFVEKEKGSCKNIELEKEIKNYIGKGYYNKDIVALINKEYHLPKKVIYKKVLELRKQDNDRLEVPL